MRNPRRREVLVDLVAPGCPSRPLRACEQFDVRAFNKPLDPLMHAIGLARMLAPRLDDRLPHTFVDAFRITARRQKTRLSIGPCPIAETHYVFEIILKKLKLPGVRFRPIESACLVLESPCVNDAQAFGQMWPDGPQEQHSIRRAKLSNRQRTNVLARHRVVMTLDSP